MAQPKAIKNWTTQPSTHEHGGGFFQFYHYTPYCLAFSSVVQTLSSVAECHPGVRIARQRDVVSCLRCQEFPVSPQSATRASQR